MQTDEDIWKSRAVKERKREWEILKEKEEIKKLKEEIKQLKGEENEYVSEIEEETSDNDLLNETLWSHLSSSPKKD